MQRHETSEFDELNELSKDELISRLKEKEAVLKETEAALKKQEAHAEATRKKHEALTSAAREKFTSVINDLNNEKEELQKKLKKSGATNADNFADSSMVSAYTQSSRRWSLLTRKRPSSRDSRRR